MVHDNLRRRLDVPKKVVVRHARTTRDSRYDAVRSSADLEKRIRNLEQLVGLLTDMLLGLISACFAIAGTALAGGGFYWQETITAAVIAFLIATWISNFLFPNATRRIRNSAA
jgi:hypothetical protein